MAHMQTDVKKEGFYKRRMVLNPRISLFLCKNCTVVIYRYFSSTSTRVIAVVHRYTKRARKLCRLSKSLVRCTSESLRAD